MRKFIKQNINKIIVLIIYVVMFYVVGELIPIIFGDYVQTQSQAILFTVINNAIIYITLIVSCLILLNKEIITDFKKLEKQNAVKVFLTCLAGVGLVYAGNIVGSILTSIFGGTGSSANQEALEKILFSPYGFLMIVFIVVVGPIVEELVFRKSMHEILRSLKLPTWLVLGISSVLFGLIHVISAGDFVEVFPYILMGVTIGSLEIKTKNIYPSIFVHIFINALSTAMIFYLDIFQDLLGM